MKVATLIALFALAIFAFSAFAEEENVVTLTTSTFDEFVANNPYTLVEFYAPWCGHCKKLAPEFEKAATTLKEEGSEIKLAKVDCTVESELATRFHIQGFPTLIWFRDGRQSAPYQNERTASAIVSWTKKKSGPVVQTPTTKEEFETMTSNKEAVVGFFNKDSLELSAFTETASAPEAEKLVFVSVVDPELTKELGGSVNQIKILRTFDEPAVYDGEISKEQLLTWVSENGAPYLAHASESWERLSKRNIPITVIFADISTPEWGSTYLWLNKMAKAHLSTMGLTFVGKELFDRAKAMGLSGEKFPAAVTLNTQTQKNFIFDESLDFTEENLENHLKGVLDGSIKAHFKTQPVPETNDGPVLELVGSTFNDLVINNDKDVFVEFYAPWCGHCKSLAPVWEELGTKFEGNEHVVIAKLDASNNDNDAVQIKGFPTIYLFPAGDKANPIQYNSGRTFNDFVAFLEDNATHLKGKPASKDTEKDEL